MLSVVYSQARNLQTYPAWKGYANYEEFGTVPTCIVRAGEFIRAHSPRHDVIQDEDNDRAYHLTAIAERQSFAIDETFGGSASERTTRLAQLRPLVGAPRSAILDFMREKQIQWYLVHPHPSGAVERSPAGSSPFECGGYVLLHDSR
jgi:hypothetical protein